MEILREVVGAWCERVGLLRPKAEVIDLSDLFESKRLRREAEQFRRQVRELLGEPPEPPKGA